MNSFRLASSFMPMGDQPQAIAEICDSFNSNVKHHTLIGVTGSGKTFTMANVIEKLRLPTLVMAPNKTLAAQLFTELREFFPENAVEFFISYYDYYQPEAYIPTSDTYIAKDSAINDDIDKMRHSATRALFERSDVIIVASVSCIYGLGSPKSYAKLVASFSKGQAISRKMFLHRLVEIQYTRNDAAIGRGNFRVRGDSVDILPSHQKNEMIRIEFFGDEIELISIVDSLNGQLLREVDEVSIYPNSHYVTDVADTSIIVRQILADLGDRLREYKALGRLIEYQRLEQRVMHDVEMFEQLGWCTGIENYSRYLTGLPSGHPPPTLLDYFPKDFLIILDESHITVPQIGGMYRGDRSRKQTLVDHGFRLPSALDNRPLNFDEFMERTQKILYVSATPNKYELEQSVDHRSEQIIRPTGLVDPPITIRSAKNQVDDLLSEIKKTTERGGRILVTTLTKKMAEDLATYYAGFSVRVRYLHSDIESLERVEILRDLRRGELEVLIGINLLREGLDLPEVELVAVMDADKEGFLRSRTALIQVSGRAARNINGQVIFYADHITDSMKACIDETDRRRAKQEQYNKEQGITPESIRKKLPQSLREIYGLSTPEDGENSSEENADTLIEKYKIKTRAELERLLRRKTTQMQKTAAKMEFEKAAEIRDEVNALRNWLLTFGDESGI